MKRKRKIKCDKCGGVGVESTGVIVGTYLMCKKCKGKGFNFMKKKKKGGKKC